jgi:hypothetical protein
MRKTDDEVILRMKAEGATGKAIAAYFQVSEAAISKRLKRLRPIQEPVSFANLTDKQKRFVLLKAEGKTNTSAALEAFDATTRAAAKTIGSVLMKDPDVSKAIQEIMAEEGLTRRHVVRRLRDLVDHPDGNIAIKGIDVANKLSGDYAPEKRDVRVAVGEIRVFKTSFSGEEDDSETSAVPSKTVSEDAV